MTFRSTNNILLTQALFYEICSVRKRPTDRAKFSMLSKSDARWQDLPEGNSLVSARDTYVALKDITGFEWSKLYLENFQHFEVMYHESDWFKTEVDSWNTEILMARKSEALRTIMGLSTDEAATDAVRLSASKYVAERGWDKKTSKGRGRPSKEVVAGEVKEQARKLTAVSKDAERIGLVAIEGGKA